MSQICVDDTIGIIWQHTQFDMSLNPYDDSTIDHDVETPTDHEKPKLYNKALFLLKLKEEQRLPQVVINSLIGDVSTLLEEEILSLKKDVIQCMQEGYASTELTSRVNEQFTKQIATTPFEGLHTSYLQKKYYIDHFHLVVRVIILGTSRTQIGTNYLPCMQKFKFIYQDKA